MKKLEDYFKEPPKPESKKAKSLKALKKQAVQEHSLLMKTLESEEKLYRELSKN